MLGAVEQVLETPVVAAKLVTLPVVVEQLAVVAMPVAMKD